MVQLEHLRPGQPSVFYPAPALPCRIGRGGRCELRLPEPGVWEEHAELSLEEDDRFRIARLGEGSLILNGESIDGGRIRSGDTIELGATRLRFWLTPVRPCSQALADKLFWAMVVGVFIAMIALMAALPH